MQYNSKLENKTNKLIQRQKNWTWTKQLKTVFNLIFCVLTSKNLLKGYCALFYKNTLQA